MKPQFKVCVLFLGCVYSQCGNRYLWKWHNSSQDWYLHCQLLFHSQILKSRLSRWFAFLWGPASSLRGCRLILSRQAVWHAAPEVVPYQPYQALHPYAAQPSHTMLLCTQHIQEVSHDEINPLIILAALNWIPHLRTLFYGAPQKAKRRSGQTWLWAVFMEGSQRCGHQIVSNTLFGVLSLVWWQRWCKAVLKGIS